MTKKDVMVVCGTRPEIIKMAPVYKALQQSNALRPVLVHTGQHTDLATPLYEFFQMNVDHSIELVREKSSLAHLTAILMDKLGDVIVNNRPSAVLVHGDTSSAAVAAQAAFYEQIPVGHVEAGLRTNDRYSPFPEEMNRSLIGRLANWHFAPTAHAQQALQREGLVENVLVTGNTVVDAARLAACMLKTGHVDPFVQEHHLAHCIEGHRLILVTAHRRENWGAGLVEIAHGIADILEAHPDVFVVWPLHANPAVQKVVRETLAERQCEHLPRLMLTPPLDYSALIWLLSNAWATLTDSGGIQEEAAALGTPVLVLRDSTERPELIEAGGGVLVGANRGRIGFVVDAITRNVEEYEAMRAIHNPFGDGTAGLQIVRFLEETLA